MRPLFVVLIGILLPLCAAKESISCSSAATPRVQSLVRFYDKKSFGWLKIVGVIAMFGFLNRWNDTFATPIEDEPLEFGEKHLTAQGWDAGKHLR